MAAMRCSRVDLPEPEGPISATKSPFPMSMSTSFSAITWNSSRTNSFVRRRAVMTGSLIQACLFYPYLIAILQVGGRIHDQILAAVQPVVDANALIGSRACFDGPPHSLALESHEDG